ncbi:hypothetical protein AA3990_0031 [Gluconobacter roseus NBRC 3990]|nr:hypothetical protein AA3990_0031 [Gluconobacter roseus NBRC 3990]
MRIPRAKEVPEAVTILSTWSRSACAQGRPEEARILLKTMSDPCLVSEDQGSSPKSPRDKDDLNGKHGHALW